MNVLASIQLDQTDRRFLIVAIIALTLFFIVFALIGALTRIITRKFGERLDYLVHDAVKYRVIDNKKHFKKYARAKNGRKFVKDATPAILILLVSVIFYVIYGIVSETWTGKYFTEFSTIFWKWDFANEDNYVIFWGAKVLAKWPELTNTPHLVKEYWPSYILATLWSIGGIYLLFAGWAYLARSYYIFKRADEVYKKTLEGFNYYGNETAPAVNPLDIQKAKEKSGSNQ